jgi:tape measure domain-containing protein
MSFQIKYVYDLVDKISPQLKTIQTNLQTAASSVNASAATIARSFDKVDQSLKNTGKSFQNAGATLAPLSLAMGGIAVKAFKGAAEFEMLRIRMDVLTGSTEMGAKAFQEVTKYAAKTPFEIADISKSLNMLMSTGGLSFDEAMKSVKVIGDIASISGGEMSGMALAFSQTAATTKLLGQDFNQFVNNSVPLMKILTDYTGKSTSEIMEMKTAGKLSFDIVSKAMEKATKAGGLFENGAEKMSKTLGGLFSTLKDDVNIAFAELGSEMAKAINLSQLVKNLSEFASEMTQKFKALSPETKKFITFLVLATTVLAPLLLVLGSLVGILGLAFSGLSILAGGFALIFTPVGLITAGIIGLAAAAYLCRDSFVVVYDFLKDQFLTVFDSIIAKIDQAVAAFNKFRTDASSVLSFVGLDSLANSVAPNSPINQAAPINTPQQSFAAGGQLDINLRGLPKGSNSNFTPAPKNFMNVGVNSVYAGAY